MNNQHDIKWRDRTIFTDRQPTPWKLIVLSYAGLGIGAFVLGVWIA